MGNSHKKPSCLEPVAQIEPNFDGIVIGWSSSKMCPAVALSRQDGRHSAVALLLKAALIQVSDYRLLGASGCSLQSRVRTHTILVKDWYELLGNPTT